MSQDFRCRKQPVDGVECKVEQMLAKLADAGTPIEHRRAGKVDVVLHTLHSLRICAHFDDRRDRIAQRRPATGGKDADLRAAGHHAGNRFRIITRRIHHYQSLLTGGIGIADHLFQDGSAAFVDAAQGLFLNGSQAALGCYPVQD